MYIDGAAFHKSTGWQILLGLTRLVPTFFLVSEDAYHILERSVKNCWGRTTPPTRNSIINNDQGGNNLPASLFARASEEQQLSAWLQTPHLRSTSRGHPKTGVSPHQPTPDMAATVVGASQPWQPRVLQQTLRKKRVYEAHLAEAHRHMAFSPCTYLAVPTVPPTHMSEGALSSENGTASLLS